MKTQLYQLKYYTEEGDLKAPIAFNFILLFIARTWILLIASVVSREFGNNLLQIFYPDKMHFYLGLLLGMLTLVIFFISGRRHAQKRWAFTVWPFCLYLVYFAIVADLLLQLYYLNIAHFQYSLTASIQLVLILWSALFAFNSKQLKDSFKK